jgi:hypothetical protein
MPEKARPPRPPRGYEWLPDAFLRDVGSDSEQIEFVRECLAEGDISAKLLDVYGELRDIPARAWRKAPFTEKVYPRFTDGWMRLREKLGAGPYHDGWVYVNVRKWQEYITPSLRKSGAGNAGKAGEEILNAFEGDAPKRKLPKRDFEKDGTLKNRIETVLAAKKRLQRSSEMSERILAKVVFDEIGKKVGFSESTIRQIISGKYKPMAHLGISHQRG